MNNWNGPSIKLSKWYFWWLLGLLVVGCQSSAKATPVASGGIPVATPFSTFYAQYGGEKVLGQPISGLCTDDTGRVIQYFDRVRLDYDPINQSVAIFPLGQWAFAGLANPAPAPNVPHGQSRYFPETDQSVQGDFLSFYEAINGLLILGLPISAQIDEGELRVQYFENGRLEWHPELAIEHRVQIGVLAQAHYAATAGQLQCASLARPVNAALLTSVNVSATLKEPVLYPGKNQEIYVTVMTNGGSPVEAAHVELKVTYNGKLTTIPLGTTNGEGKINGPIILDNFTPGQYGTVEVVVSTPTAVVVGSISLSFKTWW